MEGKIGAYMLVGEEAFTEFRENACPFISGD